MILLMISFLAGVVTIASPCILPVLPFVFARKGGLGMFGGLAAGFSLVLVLATVSGQWAAELHETGRSVALVLMALFGLSMLFPALGERLFKPAQTLAQLISPNGQTTGRWSEWMLGVSTGLLWAPCAGPVLGALLAGANVAGGSTPQTTAALMAFAVGSATAFIAARVAFGKIGHGLSSRFGSVVALGMNLRRTTGALMLIGVALIASGLGNQLAVRLPGAPTEGLEKTLLEQSKFNPFTKVADAPALALPVLGTMPSLQGGTGWLRGNPVKDADLRGKVVLVEFWTFGCINCQRAIPYVQAWHKKFANDGLVVIGVHTPEFAFERNRDNVQKAMDKMGLDFLVTMDNNFTVWNQWSNQYWPTLYLVDGSGKIRWKHIGEGSYKQTEEAIRQLIRENKAQGT